MSTKPEYESQGELEIPFETFYRWAVQFLSPGTAFVTFGHVKESETGLVIKYRQNSEKKPLPPVEPELLPAPPPAPQPLPPA